MTNTTFRVKVKNRKLRFQTERKRNFVRFLRFVTVFKNEVNAKISIQYLRNRYTNPFMLHPMFSSREHPCGVS